MSVLFRSRRVLACLPAIALAALAIHETTQPDLKITPKYDDSSVEVALIAPEELAPPPPPEPVVETPPTPPEPVAPPQTEEIVEAPVVEPPPPKPAPKPPVAKPVAKPKPQPQPKARPEPQVAKAPPPAAPQPVRSPTPPPAQPAVAKQAVASPKPEAADMESRYVARLLAELEKYKQYPRGREASLQRPEGNVVVWLLVDRSGKVLDSGIEKKATNMLLNRAAQTSLKRLDQVVPFPENSFSGKDKYRFTATLVYNMK